MAYVTRGGRPIFSKNTARIIVQSKLFEFMHLTGPQLSEVNLDVIWDDYLRQRKIFIDTSRHIIRTKKMMCSIDDPIEVLTRCYRRDVVLRIWIVGLDSKTSSTRSLRNRIVNLNDEKALLSEDSAGEPEDSQSEEEEVERDDPNAMFRFRRQSLPPLLLPQVSESIQNIHGTIPTLRGKGILATPRRNSGRVRKIPARFMDEPPVMKTLKRPTTRGNKSVCFNIPSPPSSPERNSPTIKSYKSSHKLPNTSRSALDVKRHNKVLLAKLPPHVKKVSVTANGNMAGSAASGKASAAVGKASAAESEHVSLDKGTLLITDGASSRLKKIPPKPSISVKLPTIPDAYISNTNITPVETPGTYLASRGAVPLHPASSVVITTSPIQKRVTFPMETHDAAPAIPGTSSSGLSGHKFQFVKTEDESSSEEESHFEVLPIPARKGNTLSEWQSGRSSAPAPEVTSKSVKPVTTPSAKPTAALNHPIGPISPSNNIPDRYMTQSEDDDDEDDLPHNDDKFKLAVLSYWKRLNAAGYRHLQKELQSLIRDEEKWYTVLEAMPRTLTTLNAALKIYN